MKLGSLSPNTPKKKKPTSKRRRETNKHKYSTLQLQISRKTLVIYVTVICVTVNPIFVYFKGNKSYSYKVKIQYVRVEF